MSCSPAVRTPASAIPTGWRSVTFVSAAACGWSSLWVWTSPLLLDAILTFFYGGQGGQNDYTLATPFTAANLGFGRPWFWDALLILTLAAAALVLAWLGLRQARKQKK